MSQRKPDTVSGVLIINKHAGVTSHKIISSVRKLYDTQRVGHTGTLDPMATGVLPILLGRAAKASDYLMMHDKEYLAELKLGLTTDTEDITGEVLSRSDKLPTEEEVRRVCARYVGKIMQTPPMYSAVKVGGQKLIDMAREGVVVERAAREIEVYSIYVEKVADDTYSLRVACSKGTYIRTLCSDIGRDLGCGGVMSSLIRTRTGDFTLEDCVTVEELDGMTFEERLKLPRSTESLFKSLPVLNISDFHAKLLRGGISVLQSKMKCSFEEGQLIRVKQRGEFVSLGRAVTVDGEPAVKQEKVFVV